MITISFMLLFTISNILTQNTTVNSTRPSEYPNNTLRVGDPGFDKFFCRNNASCSHHGYCYKGRICICDENYVTVIDGTSSVVFIQCNYQQISRSTVFLLSFFLGPLGVEHLLLGNYGFAIPKMIIPFVIFIGGTLLFLVGKKRDSKTWKVIGKLLELGCTVLIVVWWMIDWILILSGYYVDRNSIPLY